MTNDLDFRPFRAWRYHAGQELDRVIAPPYDVISAKEREALYAKSPFNVVRLILGKEQDFYERSHQSWQEWTQKGILVQDKRPAFYLYEQVFAHPWDSHPQNRLAVVGILKLNPSDAVLLHEATFTAPRKDRLELLEKTRTNLSPIFGLYPGSGKRLSSLSASYRERPTIFQARDDEGTLHRGWRVEGEEEQELVREALRREKILIADGHHRYETAVEYRRQMREKLPNPPSEAPFDFVMMALVAFEDKGLLVLPTHRILRSLGPCSKEEFLNRLQTHFEFLACPEKELFSRLQAQPQKEKVLGGLLGNAGSFILKLKSLTAVRDFLPPGKPAPWYEMEANLLTHFVFEKLWKIDAPSREGRVEYTRSWEEAAQAVSQGKAELAFLMRSPEVQAIRALADLGERMPQKTTYFYPKLASGLFFYYHG